MSEEVKILYVDDEFLNLCSFEMLFKEKYKIFTASGGKKGLEIFDKNDIKIVISDQKMPQMTGVEFLEEICKKDDSTLRIIHSGFSDSVEIKTALEKNVAQFCLDKPLQQNILTDIIEDYVKRI
ncbi:MAG TPA: response regulator [Spirochaetota bacterium]|nr:response regulator [Spirochaetota bacterium]